LVEGNQEGKKQGETQIRFGANSVPVEAQFFFSLFFNNLTPFMTKKGILMLCFPYFVDTSNVSQMFNP
jgi:hypothetical protein